MVVDPSNYDVSELREQSASDDTSTSEDDASGFDWVTGQENNRREETENPSLQQINGHDGWQTIVPDEHGQSGESNQTSASESVELRQIPDSESKESGRQRLTRAGVDPINYDLGELRTVSEYESATLEPDTEAHGFVWSTPPEQYRTRIEDPTSEQYQRILTIIGIDPELVGEKPYLTTLPTEAAGALVIDWLEFLTGEAGTGGAIDALERYGEIGWFTERVGRELRDSMLWIDHRDGNGFCVFDRGDHLLSFAYVAKIASVNSEGMMFY